MKGSDYLERPISWRKGADGTQILGTLTIREMVGQIENGTHSATIEKVRAIKNDNARRAAKEKLVCWMPGGTFSGRGDANLKQASGAVVLDGDIYPDPEMTRHRFESSPHTLVCARSSSGRDYFALAIVDPIPANATQYKEAFDQVIAHYGAQYAASDQKAAERGRFVTVDPNVYVNEDATPLSVTYSGAKFIRTAPIETSGEKVKPGEREPYLAQKIGSMIYQRFEPAIIHSTAQDINATCFAVPHEPQYIEDKVNDFLLRFEPGPDETVTQFQARMYRHSMNGQAVHDNGEIVQHEAQVNGEGGAYMDEFILDCLYAEEVGDARLFTARMEDLVLYDNTAKSWVYYDKGVYKTDKKQYVKRKLIQLLAPTYSALSKTMDDKGAEEQKKGTALTENKFYKIRDKLRKRVNQINKAQRISSVLGLAAVARPIISEEFDTDPMLFNIKNGTMELETQTFRGHRPEDRLSKMADIVYDPDAECPKWTEFLKTVFNNDKDLIAYVQKIVGYCLTALTDLDIMVFCYGNGGNGKTVFFNVLGMLLGDYCVKIPTEVLLNRRQQQSTDQYYMVSLHGARCAVGSEIPGGRTLNESLVKDITGGDKKIQARSPYGKPFDFAQSHKLFLYGNHKPTIKGADDGIWRRVKIIPFTVTIPEDKRKKRSVLEAGFREELSGILNWALKGLSDYKKDGLNEPVSVTGATKEYRDESDAVGVALNGMRDDKIISNKSASSVKGTVLYNEYCAWCDRNSDHKMTRGDFYEKLRKKGIEVKTGAGNATFVYGIELTSAPGLGLKNGEKKQI